MSKTLKTKRPLQKQGQGQGGKDERKIYDPYIKSLLSMKLSLNITEIGSNIKQNLEKMIVSQTEGRCIVEGYIRPDSIQILTYSCGKINGDKIEYHATFECMICHPVEGMLVECICKTITKAGIHAVVEDRNGNTPIVVFIARDHHIANYLFEQVVENAKLRVRIIGIRYELNDPNICAIGKLLENVMEE